MSVCMEIVSSEKLRTAGFFVFATKQKNYEQILFNHFNDNGFFSRAHYMKLQLYTTYLQTYVVHRHSQYAQEMCELGQAKEWCLNPQSQVFHPSRN